MKYHVLREGKDNQPTGLFREIETETEYRLEHLTANGAWILNYDLAKYLFGGEISDLVSEAEAKAIQRNLAKGSVKADSVREMRMAGLPVKRH